MVRRLPSKARGTDQPRWSGWSSAQQAPFLGYRDLLPAHRHRRPSRVAYVEARDDETKETATDLLRNAFAWFAERGVTVQRVLSDNGSCYKSKLWTKTGTDLGITAKNTRPYRPQTNGKIEGFHRTLAEPGIQEVLQLRISPTRRSASMGPRVQPPPPHTAIKKAAPITGWDNLAGHHN